MINIGNDSINNILLGDTQVDRVYLGTDIVWEHSLPVVTKNYLKFTALESGTFTLTIPASVTATHLTSISYSLDNGATWVTTQNTSSVVTITTPTVAEGGTVLWKGSGTQMATSNSSGYYSKFTSTGNYGVTGNIMSLLYEDTFDTQKELEANYALCNLFRDCNTIITANDLEFPATELTESCYREMFGNCHYLVEARFDLPAPLAPANAYRSLFGNDERLVTADVTIYAHTLLNDCCRWMCGGCQELTTAPVILATALSNGSLQQTFNGCNKLQYIKALFTTAPSTTYTNQFTNGVASTGTFVKNGAATWTTTGVNAVPTGWTVVTEEPQDYLAFRFVESGIFYWYTSNESSFTRTIEYKKNADAWTSVTSSADGTVCTVENGDVIQLRGADQAYSASSYYCSFGTSGRAYVSGNLDSIRNYNHKLTNYCYRNLFYNCVNIDIDQTNALVLASRSLAEQCYRGLFDGCTSLTRTPELPVLSLVNACYSRMFEGCTSLTTMPELPAKTITQGCYEYMFSGCTSLINTTELYAINAVRGCYYSMFSGCTSLVIAPKIKARAFGISSCQEMFKGCTSLTTIPEFVPETINGDSALRDMFSNCTSLTVAPELPASTLETYCYAGMFKECTSLTTAPELPALTLRGHCYYYMFYGCTSLVVAQKIKARAIGAASCQEMFKGCTSLTTIPEFVSETINGDNACRDMFTNCTSLTTAPALPATTLASSCYQSMFTNCTSLTTAPALPATTLASSCYNAMFYGCTSLTTAPELLAIELVDHCYQYMFYRCTSLNYIKAMFISTPNTDYNTSEWVNYVAATGIFVKNAEAEWDVIGRNGVPNGWTVLTVSS